MPGQTEFALCLHGQIDGRKVAFTGDNIFGDPDDPAPDRPRGHGRPQQRHPRGGLHLRRRIS